MISVLHTLESKYTPKYIISLDILIQLDTLESNMIQKALFQILSS